MEIYFADKELERMARDYKYATRKLGTLRAKLFHQRLERMKRFETLELLRTQPGHFHELVGDRKGQWACDLDQPYRLIFEPVERPIPTDRNGGYIWSLIKIVSIMEIIDYHKK